MANENQFSAGEQALGYIYQIRFALLKIFSLDEKTSCYIEKDDDVDFSDPEEGKILASLKHKSVGDSLTDLSPDFWKSVRIWAYYFKNNSGKITNDKLSFFLYTTGKVSEGSALQMFLPGAVRNVDYATKMKGLLISSQSKTLKSIYNILESFSLEDLNEFFSRITIFDSQERIQNIREKIIDERLRTVRSDFRSKVYERLEGWWVDECIKLLTGKRINSINGQEVSGKLASISEEYHTDNLPIEFQYAEPSEEILPESDNRLFVEQLKSIGVGTDRIKRAILDYYRAFQQRSSWLREYAELDGELESYDDRLVEEWSRLKEIIFEDLEIESPEEILQKTGRKLFTEISTSNHENFRIRPKVTATFVHMGSYHILADEVNPRVFWHPKFKERVQTILNVE